MKDKILKLVILQVIISFFLSCSEKNDDLEIDNTPPLVIITNPSNNSVFNINTDFTISIVVDDDSNITRNELYVDGVFEGDFNQKFTYNTETNEGNHTILVKTYDEFGNIGHSDLVNFTISNLNITNFSGTILNKLNTPITDAEIYIDNNLITASNKNGIYNIQKIEYGLHTIKIIKSSLYEVYENEIDVTENTNEVDISLVSSEIPKISSLSFTDGYYKGTLNWNYNKSYDEIILGFNVYSRIWYFARDSRKIQNNNHTLIYGDWIKYNQLPIESNNLELNLEEYNVYYEFYIVPVNIDGIETNIGSYVNSSDKVISIYRPNNHELGKFELTSSYGPVEIPNLNEYEEYSLISYFLYKDITNIFEPSNWTVQISTNNGSSWHTILTNGIDIFGSIMPSDGGGYVKKINLNNYAGQTVYFRTSPSIYGNDPMEIEHYIVGFKY